MDPGAMDWSFFILQKVWKELNLNFIGSLSGKYVELL
jgi:hypothetical protein